MPQIRHKINANVVNISSHTIDRFFPTIPANQCNDHLNITENTTVNKEIKTNTIDNIARQTILHNLNNHIIKFSFIEIKNKIDELSENELKEIFKIIKNNNEKHSINKNGIFFNLNILKKNTIQEISDFLYFADNNKSLDEMDELERDKYKNLIRKI